MAIDWNNPKIYKLLGTMTDRKLAEKLGTRILVVAMHRRRRKIPSYCVKKFEVTEEHLRYLGKVPDSDFCEKFGVSPMTVIKTRKELGIPACGKINREEEVSPDWTPSIIEMLEVATDEEIANLFDVEVVKVTAIRNRHNVKLKEKHDPC